MIYLPRGAPYVLPVISGTTIIIGLPSDIKLTKMSCKNPCLNLSYTLDNDIQTSADLVCDRFSAQTTENRNYTHKSH